MSQTLLRPLGSISAATGALTLVLLDSGLVTSWEPGFDEPRGDDLGGDPQRIIELLEADEDFVAATMKVGTGKALVLELEGATGEAEAYELPDGTLVLVEPTLSFWTDNFGRKVAEVRAMFEDAFDATRKASLAGKVDVPSGKLAVFDGNANLRPAAKSHRAKLTPGNVARLGRDGDSIFVGLRPGTYRVRRRVLTRSWAKDITLVVAYLEPARKRAKASGASVYLPPKAKAAVKAVSSSEAAPLRQRKRSSVVFAPSPALAAIVGRKEPMTLREVHAGIDAYIEKKSLKDPKSDFWFVADAKLKRVFLKDRIQIFEVPAIVRKHLTRR